jgi:hypothetical protein
VRNDEDLEIDLMFVSDRSNAVWEQEDLGLFDRLMQEHMTIVIVLIWKGQISPNLSLERIYIGNPSKRS